MCGDREMPELPLEIWKDRIKNEIEILQKLANNIQEKHNVEEHPYSKEKMKAVFEYMEEYLTCYVVKYNKKTIGTVSLIEKDGILVTFGLGLDYENSIKTGTYFYLFYYKTIIEMIERKWDVYGRKVRPKSAGIGHSGFLTFVRRIS